MHTFHCRSANEKTAKESEKTFGHLIIVCGGALKQTLVAKNDTILRKPRQLSRGKIIQTTAPASIVPKVDSTMLVIVAATVPMR